MFVQVTSITGKYFCLIYISGPFQNCSSSGGLASESNDGREVNSAAVLVKL